MADETKPEETAEKDPAAKEATEAPKPAEAPPSALGKILGIFSFIPKFYQQNKMLSLIIGGVAILLIVGGITAYFLFSKKAPEESEKTTIEYSLQYYPLPDLKLSIRKENDAIGYLVIGLTLKISAEIKVEEFKKKEPEILDVLHTYLTSVSFNTLDNSSQNCLTSSVGLERLRENIIRRINIALTPLKVDTVLFRKLICQ